MGTGRPLRAPGNVEGPGDLVDRDLRFVDRTSNSGLRTALGNAVADLATERGVERDAIVEGGDVFESLPGHGR